MKFRITFEVTTNDTQSEHPNVESMCARAKKLCKQWKLGLQVIFWVLLCPINRHSVPGGDYDTQMRVEVVAYLSFCDRAKNLQPVHQHYLGRNTRCCWVRVGAVKPFACDPVHSANVMRRANADE